MAARILLGAERYGIGRSPDCDIVIDDDSVSRFHADVARSDEGYVLSDLNTANGLLVNGQRVKEAKLRDGDVVQIGRCQMSYLEPAVLVGAAPPTETVALPLADPDPATIPPSPYIE